MILARIAFRNVRKNWRHSLSALLSISAAFVSLVLFDGYISDLKNMYDDSFRFRSMLGDVIIENPLIHSKEGLAEPSRFLITLEQQIKIDDFIKSHQGDILSHVKSINFQGVLTNGQQSSIVIGRGFDLIEGEKMRGSHWSWNTTYGQPLHLSQMSSAAVFGHGLARKMACSWDKIKNFNTFSGGYEPKIRPFNCPQFEMQLSTMTAEGQLNAVDISAVGLIDAGYKDIDDRYIVTSLETAQNLMNSQSVNLISVLFKNSSLKDQFKVKFNKLFENLKYPLKAMSWVEHPVGETYVKTLSLMSIFRNFVVVVILIISILSVMNTLVKIIKERNREIGTMRSLGFRSIQILILFVYETMMLSLLGIFIGILSALGLTFFLNYLEIRYKAGMLSEPVLFHIRYSAMDYISAVVLLLFVSLLACIYATRFELRKKIVDNFISG